jgi:hypothetical protein
VVYIVLNNDLFNQIFNEEEGVGATIINIWQNILFSYKNTKNQTYFPFVILNLQDNIIFIDKFQIKFDSNINNEYIQDFFKNFTAGLPSNIYLGKIFNWRTLEFKDNQVFIRFYNILVYHNIKNLLDHIFIINNHIILNIEQLSNALLKNPDFILNIHLESEAYTYSLENFNNNFSLSKFKNIHIKNFDDMYKILVDLNFFYKNSDLASSAALNFFYNSPSYLNYSDFYNKFYLEMEKDNDKLIFIINVASNNELFLFMDKNDMPQICFTDFLVSFRFLTSTKLQSFHI